MADTFDEIALQARLDDEKEGIPNPGIKIDAEWYGPTFVHWLAITKGVAAFFTDKKKFDELWELYGQEFIDTYVNGEKEAVA